MEKYGWAVTLLQGKTLTGETAIEMIKNGFGQQVIEHYSKFPGLDDQDIVRRLLGTGLATSIASYIEKFDQGLHKVIVNCLIDEGNGEFVRRNINKAVVDRRLVAQRLITTGQAHQVLDCPELVEALGGASSICRLPYKYSIAKSVLSLETLTLSSKKIS
ncbi:hypothetical protein KC644_01010 [Candidatus Berkelbacteria bacterium]|nr:hypothetical protein [Candidatus Berkelbacteria bacterium]